MKLGIVIYSNDSETVWNAFRFGNYALREGESVQVLLIGKGVQSESIDTETFNVTEQMRSFIERGGTIAGMRDVPEDPSRAWFGNMPDINT